MELLSGSSERARSSGIVAGAEAPASSRALPFLKNSYAPSLMVLRDYPEPQGLDRVEHRRRHRAFGSARHGALVGGGDDFHLVVLDVEADVGARDVVDHDRVQALALELAAGALDRALAVLGGEADERLVRASPGRERAENVVRGFEVERQPVPAALRDLRALGVPRAE